MRAMAILQLLIVGVLLEDVSAYSTGAGTSACNNANMAPSHSVGPMTSESPHKLTVADPLIYNVRYVTISSTETFKGFLILALPHNDLYGTSIGFFTSRYFADAHLAQRTCSDKGITHTTNFTSRNEFIVTWVPPSNQDVRSVIFMATVVTSESEYWVRLPSERVFLFESLLSTDPITTVAPVDKDVCNLYSCYRSCVNSDCDFLISWYDHYKENIVMFQLTAYLGDSYDYVAVGLSTSRDTMSEVTIISCAMDERETRIESWFSTYKNKPIPMYDDGIITDKEASVSDDMYMTCRFSYNNDPVLLQNTILSNVFWKNLADPTELISIFIARGKYEDDQLAKHTETPKISPQAVYFFSNSIIYRMSEEPEKKYGNNAGNRQCDAAQQLLLQATDNAMPPNSCCYPLLDHSYT